jgi:hypothetical protein
MTFEEQVRNVVKKDIYISLHGAAMTHILFMEPFSGIIELNPPKFKEPYYQNMAQKSRILFYGIYKTYTDDMKKSMSLINTDKILNQKFYVPLELFESMYSRAIANVWKYKYTMVDL